MRVLFIGQTGVNLNWSVKLLADYCRIYQFGLKKSQLQSLGEYTISVDYVEDKMPFPSYLDLNNLRRQQEMWDDAMQETLEELNNKKSKNSFLGMNLPHYRKDKFFPVPNMELISQFKPDMIITLIDDIHTCYQRIKKRSKTRSIFSLKDILVWRSVSIYVGDMLSHSLKVINKQKVENFVVAVKHPPSMFQKLIFQPQIPRIYCSFSITGIRENGAKKGIVNEFRNKMHQRFCIFDPLTIDDRLSQNQYEKLKGSVRPSETISIDGKERWQLGNKFSLMDDILSEKDHSSVFPIDIKVSEIQEIAEKKVSEQGEDASVIDNQIRERDFRLIDQSDTMVAFRPNISGKISDGVTEESNYVSQVNPKEWYYIWPKKEDGEIETGPFKPFVGIGIQYDDQDELIDHLEKKLTKPVKK